MEGAWRTELIARYRDGHAAIVAPLEGITLHDPDARPADGSWTAREVVHHVADSETTSSIRLRRLLVEEDALIVGYDEEAWARVLRYADREIGPSLKTIAGTRASTAQLLDLLTDAQWARTGTHSESGPYGLERWLEIYAGHAHDHANQIREARAAAGR